MEALAQACRAPSPNNEYFDIVDNEPESGDDVIEIYMEIFSSVIQSNLNNCPLYYSGDSYCTNRRRRSEISKAAKLTGQDLFAAWGIPNTAYADEESKVPVTVRQYTNRDLSPHAVLEALELITKICYCLWNKRHMEGAVFSLETPYDTISVLTVREYL